MSSGGRVGGGGKVSRIGIEKGHRKGIEKRSEKGRRVESGKASGDSGQGSKKRREKGCWEGICMEWKWGGKLEGKWGVIVEGEIIKSKWEGKWGKWEWKYVGKEAKRVVVQ